MKELIDELKEAHRELIKWLNTECPAVALPLEPYTTADLSHNFCEGLRNRLDNISALESEQQESQIPVSNEAWYGIKNEFIAWDNEGHSNASQRQILDWFESKLSPAKVLTDEEIEKWAVKAETVYLLTNAKLIPKELIIYGAKAYQGGRIHKWLGKESTISRNG